MFCREQAARLGAIKSQIEAKGAQLVAIGNGHARWALSFIEEENVDYPVYVDPGRRSYRAFGMKRGLSRVFNPKSAAHSARALAAGFRQTATRGDGYQNGGVMVFDAKGRVVFTHIEKEAGDLADLDAVLAALE